MGRPRKFVEADVIRAAREQFRATGYAGTSVEELTEATGLGKSSLYGAFGGKHELYLRALDSYRSDSVLGFARQLDGPAPALDRIRALLLDTAHAIASDTELQGCLLAKSVAECAGQDPAVAAGARRTFAELAGLLASALRQAQIEGDLDRAADPDQLADLLLTVLRGLDALGAAGISGQTLRRAAEAAVSLLPRHGGPSPADRAD
jgi:AcrR family transcriptional regulator